MTLYDEIVDKALDEMTPKAWNLFLNNRKKQKMIKLTQEEKNRNSQCLAQALLNDFYIEDIIKEIKGNKKQEHVDDKKRNKKPFTEK